MFEGSRRLLEYELVKEVLTEKAEGRASFMQVRLSQNETLHCFPRCLHIKLTIDVK